MLSRLKKAPFLKKVGRLFSFLPADVWSLLGLLIGLASAVLLYRGMYAEGALVLLLSGIVDEIDGSVARALGTTKFGGILDSTSDRVVEGFVFAALSREFPIAALALVFSFLVSYTRARAECEIERCDVGIGERAERLGVLVIGLLGGWIWEALVFVSAIAALTVIWRVEYAREVLKAGNSGQG